MRNFYAVVLTLAMPLAALGQDSKPSGPASLKNPADVFALAEPFYDFNATELKPWHLKASYQLFDENGASEQGTYEYWWVSPAVNRSTWMRSNGTHTDWHTADGRHAYQGSGESPSLFEYKLQSALISPLPDASELDPAKFRLDREMIEIGGVKHPCIMVIPHMPQHAQMQIVPLGMFPTYCFDPKLPLLRISYSFGTVTVLFSRFVEMQNHYLAKEIEINEGKRRILSATVDSVTTLSPADAALTPSADAKFPKTGPVDLVPAVAQGFILKKQVPVYPQDAKDARVSGEVVLHAIIGRDGKVHDLKVVSAPWPSLAASALLSVSHWQYKPYLLDGEPVEVDTTINVIYRLGQ